jgi:hypothetical protein
VVDRRRTFAAGCVARGTAYHPLVAAPDIGFDYEGG